MELLILYPYDMVIDAKLFNSAVSGTLNNYFGGLEWQAALEDSQSRGENRSQRRVRFVKLFADRLRDVLGYRHVHPYGPIYDKSRPLYYFVFATDADAGDVIMRNVWNSKKPPILEDELGFQPLTRPLL